MTQFDFERPRLLANDPDRTGSLSFSSGFMMFSGVEKGCIENEWVKTIYSFQKKLFMSQYCIFIPILLYSSFTFISGSFSKQIAHHK